MTVLFAILTALLVAALLYARRGSRGVSVEGDPSHEETASWPGVVAGLAAFALIALAAFAVYQAGS